MRLSPELRQKLTEEAERRGLDPDELVAIAEEETDGGEQKPRADDEGKSDNKAEPTAGEVKVKPSLYMYLLPFVTVNEVRTIWLELGAIEGGEMNAAKYAAMQAGPPVTKPEDEP